MRRVAALLLTGPDDRQRLDQTNRQFAESGLSDVVFENNADRAGPDAVLDRLRWGGQLIVALRRPRQLDALARAYRDRPEFTIETPPRPLPRDPGWRGKFAPAVGVLVVRKTLLDRPERLLTRHSFDVRLARLDDGGGYVVTKRVPTMERAVAQLTQLMGPRPGDQIERVARKLVDKVFPVLLTREAGFLALLNQRLPEPMTRRVPRALGVWRDGRGRVTRLDMNWLRLGGEPIRATEFVVQAATLIDAIGAHAELVHLDLRLDNIVITEDGVGIVDFGSAMRIGERLTDSKMLGALFGHMLSASKLRKDLRQLTRRGVVRSSAFDRCYPRRDPAVDLFALALQMTHPWAQADFRGLIAPDPSGREVERLARLQRHVFRPRDPNNPEITCAADIANVLRGRPLRHRPQKFPLAPPPEVPPAPPEASPTQPEISSARPASEGSPPEVFPEVFPESSPRATDPGSPSPTRSTPQVVTEKNETSETASPLRVA